MKRKKVLEMYKAKHKLEDPNKKEVNDMIAHHLQQNPQCKSGSAVILDAETILTLRTLLKTGFVERKIDIVNYVPDTFKKIKRKHAQTFNLYLLDYYKSLAEAKLKNVFTLNFSDYCCTLDGNDGTSPIEDLKFYFNNKLPAKPSLLGVTLSYRTKRIGTEIELNKLVSELAIKNGYNYSFVDGTAYTGMFFNLFKLY